MINKKLNKIMHERWGGYNISLYTDYIEISSNQSKSSTPEKKVVVSKRGKICSISRKSATRLKKRICRAGNVQTWIDFTFSDDVFEGMTITEIAEKSYSIMKKMIRYVSNEGGFLIWKREYVPRRSGKMKDKLVPHFHVVLGDMVFDDFDKFCVKILKKWVKYTGTYNPVALAVACNPNSYRKVQNHKSLINYIGKYFSKTNKIKLEDGDTIGRTWGKSKNTPDESPFNYTLNNYDSVRFARIIKRYKKVNKFLESQINKRFSTFIFCDESFIQKIMRWLNVYEFACEY